MKEEEIEEERWRGSAKEEVVGPLVINEVAEVEETGRKRGVGEKPRHRASWASFRVRPCIKPSVATSDSNLQVRQPRQKTLCPPWQFPHTSVADGQAERQGSGVAHRGQRAVDLLC